MFSVTPADNTEASYYYEKLEYESRLKSKKHYLTEEAIPNRMKIYQKL